MPGSPTLRRLCLAAACLAAFAAVAAAAPLLSGSASALRVDMALLDDLASGRADRCVLAIGGEEHALRIVEREVHGPEATSLRGLIDDDPARFFLLVRRADGGLAALFRVSGATSYQLMRGGGGWRLAAVAAADFEPCAGAQSPPPALRARTRPAPPRERGTRAVADDGSRHDLLVAWTPKTRAAAGGETQIRAEIQLAVDAANLVYGNSAIGSRIRLVHALETDYDEDSAWAYEDHLYALYDPADGDMDELLPLRDRVGADFVSLIVESTDAVGNPIYGCGIGFVMSAEFLGPEFEEGALTVVSRRCAASVWTLAHELGHNRGCTHNREDADGEGAYPYSYGHRFTGDDGAGYRTVMAYDSDPASFERIPHFSNPAISWQGEPTGVPVGEAGEAHCALTQVQTDPLCATFRGERTFVDFDWTGASTGFIDAPFASIASGIEGSRDGGTLTLRGDLPGFSGLLPPDPRSYVHDGPGSTLIGAP